MVPGAVAGHPVLRRRAAADARPEIPAGASAPCGSTDRTCRPEPAAVSWEDRAVPSLFASYLRVYEPLTAFDRERQVFWRRYVREGRAVGPLEGPVKQRTAVLEALGAGWTRLPDLPDEAYALEWGDSLLVCPWNLRLRV